MVQRSVVTVGKVKCIQAKEVIHHDRGWVVALLQGVFEAGSLAEHKCWGTEKSSSGQRKGDVRVSLRAEPLLN
jgi:hypothetical protein